MDILPNKKNIEEKLSVLKSIISEMKSALVAYSGGVDSTLLIKIAHDILGENLLAVTANSPLYPASELHQANNITKALGVKHLIIKSNELKIAGFADNPRHRCYLCKKELFGKLSRIAKKEGLDWILDGTNITDTTDFRPGMEAAKAFNVRSPFKEVDLTKEEIRKISKRLCLPTHDKPSQACLASRFPYGTKITYAALKMVDAAEDAIRHLGISQVRVRHYNNLCRIEVPKEEMFIGYSKRDELVDKLKRIGYVYITFDLEGYRTGSMNNLLTLKMLDKTKGKRSGIRRQVSSVLDHKNRL